MSLMRMSPEKQAQFRAKLVDASREYAGSEEVLAVGPFQSTGQYLFTIPLIGQLMGLVGYLLYRSAQKRRSGRLPSNYLLAVTPTTVHVLQYTPKGMGVKVKKQVATFERSGLRIVDRDDGAMATTLTFEASSNGETTRFKANTPKLPSNPWSSEVIDLLSQEAAVPA